MTVASTRFANLGSLCQNSTHKQIRNNTGKYTIHLYVKLKLCYRNLTILRLNLTLMTKLYTLASFEYTFRSAATQLSVLYKTLQSFMFTDFIQFQRRHIFKTTKKSNIQYCTLHNSTLKCSKFSLSKNKTKIKQMYTVYTVL